MAAAGGGLGLKGSSLQVDQTIVARLPAGSGFGGTVGTTATPSATPMGGGTAMQPGEGTAGFGGGASAGTGAQGAMQGTAGGEAMGGGVLDPTPVDKKQGA